MIFSSFTQFKTKRKIQKTHNIKLRKTMNLLAYEY